MKKFFLILAFLLSWVGYTAPSAYVVYNLREKIKDGVDHKIYIVQAGVGNQISDITKMLSAEVQSVSEYPSSLARSLDEVKDSALKTVHDEWDSAVEYVFSWLEVDEDPNAYSAHGSGRGYINASYDLGAPPPPLTLSELKKRKIEDEDSLISAQISPSAGNEPPQWQPEQNELFVESVLVPRQVTVISSSQDGQIKNIPFGHGDIFKKGDVLVSYDCDDLVAEADIVRAEKDLTRTKRQGSDELFKLDIISDLDRMSAKTEDTQADAKARLYEARLKDCQIKAEFDGRITNKLANPGEYTRTDRVLLEVASIEPLKAEFLIPSKWLRWINVGAPVEITLNETERNYIAKIERIHGEIDPVSQSIQVIAVLEPYEDALLPGMSGKAKVDVSLIRAAGVRGYLESASLSKTQ